MSELTFQKGDGGGGARGGRPARGGTPRGQPYALHHDPFTTPLRPPIATPCAARGSYTLVAPLSPLRDGGGVARGGRPAGGGTPRGHLYALI